MRIIERFDLNRDIRTYNPFPSQTKAKLAGKMRNFEISEFEAIARYHQTETPGATPRQVFFQMLKQSYFPADNRSFEVFQKLHKQARLQGLLPWEEPIFLDDYHMSRHLIFQAFQDEMKVIFIQSSSLFPLVKSIADFHGIPVIVVPITPPIGLLYLIYRKLLEGSAQNLRLFFFFNSGSFAEKLEQSIYFNLLDLILTSRKFDLRMSNEEFEAWDARGMIQYEHPTYRVKYEGVSWGKYHFESEARAIMAAKWMSHGIRLTSPNWENKIMSESSIKTPGKKGGIRELESLPPQMLVRIINNTILCR